jgi:N-acetylglucosamine transport system permease protein
MSKFYGQSKIKGCQNMKNNLLKIILFIFIIFWVIVQVYPVIIMYLNSFKDTGEFMTNPWGFPGTFRFENWSEVWSGGRVGDSNSLGRYFLNTTLISFCSIAVISLLAVLSGYAFTFYKFPGKKIIFALIVGAIAIPVQSLLIPIFYTLGDLGLRNNYLGIIGVYIGFWLPFTILIIRANMQSIPKEIIEASRIDGCSEFRLIWTIIVPLSKGAIASLAIVNLIGIWSELLYAFVLMNKPDTRTLTVGIMALSGEYVTDWPQIFAGLSIATLPIVLLYLIFQRQISKAMTLGAIK